MELTTKTAQRLQELNKEIDEEFEEHGQRTEYWYELHNQLIQIINFKNELKEITDTTRDYTFNRWHKLTPDELRGIIEEYQEELANITKFIQEIESV